MATTVTRYTGYVSSNVTLYTKPAGKIAKLLFNSTATTANYAFTGTGNAYTAKMLIDGHIVLHAAGADKCSHLVSDGGGMYAALFADSADFKKALQALRGDSTAMADLHIRGLSEVQFVHNSVSFEAYNSLCRLYYDFTIIEEDI